jgi:hypothetical protein
MLLKTLALPPAERLRALKPDSTVGGRKKRNFTFFSFALGAFPFFALFFLRALFWLRARERESAKKAPAPTSAKLTSTGRGIEAYLRI